MTVWACEYDGRRVAREGVLGAYGDEQAMCLSQLSWGLLALPQQCQPLGTLLPAISRSCPHCR